MKFEDVEAARREYWGKFRKALLVSVFSLILVSTPAFIFSPLFMAPIVGFVIIVIAIVFALVISKDRAAYHKAYKAYFVEQSLHKIFTDVSYDRQKGLPASLLAATGMINTGDDYNSNDLTIAKYKNISFSQADVQIQTESTDSDGHTTYTTIFKGRFMIFEFPKKFDFKLELIGKKFHAYRVPGKDEAISRKMSKVKTESEDFNRAFKIYGQDGYETFYLLDPAMIARIEDISDFYKNKILIGFYDNKILVALDDGKDSFEPPRASKPINEAEEMKKVASSIKIITDFVDVISSH